MGDFEQDSDLNDTLREAMDRNVGFFLLRSGPILGVELASNGYIIRVRKIRKCVVPSADPMADPMLPVRPSFEHAGYEDKIICATIEAVQHEVRNILQDARDREIRNEQADA